MLKLYRSYLSFRPFTEQEAWGLFRLAAIGEAVGWSLLIFGIVWRDYLVPGNEVMVQLGGRIHGVLFLLYIVTVLLVAPSLRWSFIRTIIGGLMSMPPYGSLVFEWAVASHRGWTDFKRLSAVAYYRMATQQTVT